MARCLTCGRRFAGAKPACGHEPPPSQAEQSAPSGLFAIPAVDIPGHRLGSILGRGGFGIVLAAVREADGRAVAVKVVHRSNASARERLRLEARALETIGPPHVPELYDTGTLADGSPYFVFEYLTLPALDAKLADRGPLDVATFGALAQAILVALAAAHRASFVHRDLKPENIFVQEAPALAKLIDFGIAKDTVAEGAETTTGMALGTPEYMAPEQCEGRLDIDRRADIYAAGVVMYEMLTGRPPFFGSPADVRAAHVGRRPTPPSHVAPVTPVFDDLILRCLAKDPERRHDSADEVREALAEVMARDLDTAQRMIKPRADTDPGAGQRSQAQHMGLVFFETQIDTGRVKQVLSSLGGQLAAVEGSRCVAIFGLDTSGNPVQRAFDSAQALVSQELCMRVLVDHDRVRVRRRPDGSQRVLSAAFSDPERYPRESDPEGVLFTPTALEALPTLHTVKVRDGVLRELGIDSASENTLVQLGAGELLGRKDAFAALLDSARRAIDDAAPTIATVLSEVGYGKSHLGTAALLQLRRSVPGVQVIQLRAREPLGGESNETLRALLRATLKLPRTGMDADVRATVLSRLGIDVGEEVWPTVALVMGWLDADAPQVRKFSAAPAALRSAATRAAGEALRRLAAAGPVLCLIDDAHFADEVTLDALEYATLAEHRAPLWVCVLATPSFLSARPSWARRAAHTERIELGALDPEGAAELCRRLLRPAENVSQEAVQRIVEQTQGNPLLLVELVRGIKRHGLIRRRSRGDAWFLAIDELGELPDLPKVEWLAERELAVLPPELAAHARLVAQLGAEFTIMEVEGVLAELEAKGLGDVFPLDAQVGIKRLIAHGLLIAHRDGSYGFRHQLMRDHVAQSTSAELRLQIHQAAFRFYQETGAMTESLRLPRLAQHAAHSGLERTASAIYLELAEQAAGRHSYVDAELMYSRVLGMLPEDDHLRRMRALNGRGLVRYRLSRFEDALADLAGARAIAKSRGDVKAEIEIILDEATVLDWMWDLHASRSLVEEARALAPQELSPLLQARLSLGIGRASMRFQQWPEAIDMLGKAAEQAERLGDPGYETHVIALLLLGSAYSMGVGEFDAAEPLFERVIALCDERGDKVHLATALNNRFILRLLQRDIPRAIRDGLRCRQMCREIGMSELEYMISYNLAELYYYAGDADAAEPHLRRAIEIEPSNNKRPLSLLLEGRLLTHAGRVAEAAGVVARIAEVLEGSQQAGDMDALFIEPEDVLYQMIQLAARSAPDEDWRALRQRAEAVLRSGELAEVLEIAGLVAMRAGRADEAVRWLEDAIDESQRHSHPIEDRIHRELAALRP